MAEFKVSGQVIIGGQAFATEAPIVNFRDWLNGNPWDGTRNTLVVTKTDPNPFAQPGAKVGPDGGWLPYKPDSPRSFTARCQPRPALRQDKWKGGWHAPYDAAKKVIRQFMIHHDGCTTADMTYSVIQNERGLSCHFLVDNDGTVFQTLDLALEGWHGSELCPESIGVELCNRGDAARFPTDYARARGKEVRNITPCKINNATIKSYDFTAAQKESMIRLSRALIRLLPNLPAEYPQSSPGVQMWNTIGVLSSLRFSGFIGHYHLTTNKWDPGPWDFKDFCSKIRGIYSFPLFPRPPSGPQPPTQPQVPAKVSQLREQTDLLFAANEARADGGFFPVGPWGESRLWHGGVHLTAAEGSKVFSPFAGRLVAARMGTNTAVGSVNFVLIRHAMALSDRKLEFYTLYMHLADAMRGDAVEWFHKAKAGKDGQPRQLRANEVWLLDEPIEAGAVIGHVGSAGPASLAKGQLHLELFSRDDMFAGIKGTPWETIDGESGGRFCNAPRVNELIDADKNGVLSPEELRSFFSSNGQAVRYLVTRHYSEWSAEPSWNEALRQPKDFRAMSAADIDELVAQQITPGLWWDERVAAHCRLPVDAIVYHYHPISFVRWIHEKLIEAAASNTHKVDERQAGAVPDGITDDREGKGMYLATVAKVDPCNEKLTLKELAQGFDGPAECQP